MNKEYKETMSELRFSRAQKEQMVDHLMQAQIAPAQPARRRPLGRMAVAAIAAASILTVGAGAAVLKLASDAFAPVFGTSQTEIIDKIGRPIGASDTVDGVTITADAILGDRNNLNMIFTITKDDGTPWNLSDKQTLTFEHADNNLVERAHSGGGGASWFIDEDPTDNVLQYVQQMTIHGDTGIPMGMTKQTMENLCVYNAETQSFDSLAKGKWTLRFDVQYEDSSVDLIDQPFTVETRGGTASIESVCVSPIGFNVTGTYESVNAETRKLLDAEPAPSGRLTEETGHDRLTDLSIVLHLKDGSEMDLREYAGSGSQNGKHPTFQIGSGFSDAILPLEEMESITVGGVSLPINAAK